MKGWICWQLWAFKSLWEKRHILLHNTLKSQYLSIVIPKVKGLKYDFINRRLSTWTCYYQLSTCYIVTNTKSLLWSLNLLGDKTHLLPGFTEDWHPSTSHFANMFIVNVRKERILKLKSTGRKDVWTVCSYFWADTSNGKEGIWRTEITKHPCGSVGRTTAVMVFQVKSSKLNLLLLGGGWNFEWS